MARAKEKQRILVVDRTPESFFDIKEILEEANYTAICATSRAEANERLGKYTIIAVFCGMSLSDATGIDFVRELRFKDQHKTTPCIVVGKDGSEQEFTVAALNAGADDFVAPPVVGEAILARLNRHLQRLEQLSELSTNLQVSITELPGVLQFLETEEKSGTLLVESANGDAEIYIDRGKMAGAEAGEFTGQEAVVEVMCWPDAAVTFQEGGLREGMVGTESASGVVMNAAVSVDEYNLAQEELMAMQFLVPGTTVTKELSVNQSQIWQRVVVGEAVETLLTSWEGSKRQLVSDLTHMIEQGFLQTGDPIFADHDEKCRRQYQHVHYERRVESVQTALNELDTSTPERMLPAPQQGPPMDWMTPCPKIVIAGDCEEHLDLAAQSIASLTRRCSDAYTANRLTRAGKQWRLDFGEKVKFDFVRLPPQMTQRQAEGLGDEFLDVCAVLFLVSNQDRESNQQNLRVLRQIWQMFQGVFYFAVPVVPTEEGHEFYNIDCRHCGVPLTVDMQQAGAIVNCPKCEKGVTVPDGLDHLIAQFGLTEQTPAFVLEPASHEQIRDLVVMIMDSILEHCQAPAEPEPATPPSMTEVPPMPPPPPPPPMPSEPEAIVVTPAEEPPTPPVPGEAELPSPPAAPPNEAKPSIAVAAQSRRSFGESLRQARSRGSRRPALESSPRRDEDEPALDPTLAQILSEQSSPDRSDNILAVDTGTFNLEEFIRQVSDQDGSEE